MSRAAEVVIAAARAGNLLPYRRVQRAARRPGPLKIKAAAVEMECEVLWAKSFTATSCGSCKASANVRADNEGFFCPCNHYNVMDWHHRFNPHDQPTYGPTAQQIQISRQYSPPQP